MDEQIGELPPSTATEQPVVQDDQRSQTGHNHNEQREVQEPSESSSQVQDGVSVEEMVSKRGMGSKPKTNTITDTQFQGSIGSGDLKLGQIGDGDRALIVNRNNSHNSHHVEANGKLNQAIAQPSMRKQNSEKHHVLEQIDDHQELQFEHLGLHTYQPKEMMRLFEPQLVPSKSAMVAKNDLLHGVSTNSMQLQNIYYKITNKWGDKQVNEMMHKKYKQLATEQKNEIMKEFGDHFPEIMSYIRLEQQNNQFSIIWAKLLLIVFTYNFFTTFWMIGFPGFPSYFWYYIEVTAEIISFIDFVVRIGFPIFLPDLWQNMHLLHDRSDDRVFLTTMRGIASIPSSLILSGALHDQPETLKSFWVAILRLHKICRFRSFSEYFYTETKADTKTWVLNLLSILFAFFMGLHFLNICWILPDRFQDKTGGWYKAAGYYDFPDVSNWTKYLDAFMYVISNMSGMGFGNVVPLTNGEWISACFIFTIGCSVYLRYFADFTTSVSNQNQLFMENHLELEKFKTLADVRHLPEKLRSKIRYYFKNLRIPFEEFKRRNSLVNELPVSLKEEVSLVVNQSLIHGVKFFQFCSPDFIMKICRHLKPHICIINEHVFYKDSAALRLFFINEGVCEIVASDEKTLLRFMSKGTFFGEIGCFLTGKRTCSVIVRTTTILHAIRKEPLLSILDEYPAQLKYLQQVSKQRLEKVHPQHVDSSTEAELEKIKEQMKQLDAVHTVFGQNETDNDNHSNLPRLQAEFIQNMQQMGRLANFENDDRFNNSQFSQYEHFTTTQATATKDIFGKKETKQNPRLWQTREYMPEYFLVIPFSPLFLAWNALLAVVIIYDTFMICFQSAFEFHLEGGYIAVDVVCYCLLAIDMFMRSKTAITTPQKLCFDREKVFAHYLNEWFLLDLLATFPVCYFLMISPTMNKTYIAWSRLPRLLKIGRLYEIIEIFKWNSDIRIEVYRLIQLFLLYGLTGHIFACGFRLIGQNDYHSDVRFDKMTLYKYTETRPQLKGLIDSVGDLNPWQMYAIMFYFGIGLCGACPYGDMIPYTPLEEIFDIIGQCWVRVMWAVIIAECSSYVGSLHQVKALHDQKRDFILNWLRQQRVSEKLMERYKDYELCMWENFQGIEEEKLLKTLPRSLRLEIRSHIFKNLIENWEAFPHESQGTVQTVIRMLHMSVYPAYEYIITAGEIANEMYFIVKGVVEIRSTENEVLNTLKQGQNFGEMALLGSGNNVRMAHAVSQTMVSLAVLTKANFEQIRDYFPSFYSKLEMMAKVRKTMNAKLSQKLKEERKNNSPVINLVPMQKPNGRLTVIHEADSNSLLSASDLEDRIPSISNKVAPNLKAVFEAEKPNNLQMQSSEPLMTLAKEDEEAHIFAPSAFNPNGTQNTLIKIPLEMIQIANDEKPLTLQVETPIMGKQGKPDESNQSSISSQTSEDHNDAAQVGADFRKQVPKQTPIPDVQRQSVRKVMNKRASISVHFEEQNKMTETLRTEDNCAQINQFVHVCVSFLCFYNLAFIPIQFGFRVRFTGVFLALEVLTILLYLTEVLLRVRFYLKLHMIKSMRNFSFRNSIDRALQADQEQLQEKIDLQKTQIIVTLIAVFPISLIIASTGKYEPFGWLLWLQSLRLVKVRPIFKFWRWAKTFGINIITLFEVIFYYYIAAHWLSGVMIGMSLFLPDHRDSWLRRLPSPSPNPIRLTPNVYDDLTPLQLFNYALYFQVNTLSNLTVGDISPVTFQEKFLCAFNIWVGTFLYNFLYANIAAVVQFLVSSNHIDFFAKYNNTLEKIKNGKVADKVINNVRIFFDYIWFRHRGVDFSDLRKTLPASLSTDISLNIYENAIERSLLFCDSSGQIDIPLAVSVFKQVEVRQFLASNFLVKVGQLSTQTIILLEGNLRIYGLYNNELLGYLTAGSHFGLDLSSDFSERDDICSYDPRVCTGFKMDFASDNFDNRSIVNVVSNSIVTVAVISESQRNQLYKAFPNFKQRMQFMNRAMFQLGKLSLERHTEANNFENSKYFCKNLQLDNIMHSTQAIYSQIIDSNLHHPNNMFDVHLFIKKCYLQFNPLDSNIINTSIQHMRLLKTNLKVLENFDSEGNVVNEKQNKWVVQRDSVFVKIMKVVQFINILYIAFAVPFEVCFDVEMSPELITAEVISILVQSLYMAMILRTPVMVNGKPTVHLRQVLHNYMYEGLFIDAIGLLPLNLILGAATPQASIESMTAVIIVSLLRLTRALCIWRGLGLIDEFTVYLGSRSYYIILLKAIGIWFIQGHGMACSWVYLTLVIERSRENTWFLQQKLSETTLPEQYLRAYYFSLNIATGIGSGDMIPQNDLERFCMSVFMTVGDVIWVFGFGLIWSFWGLKVMDKTEQGHKKIKALEAMMESLSITTSQRHLMEKYFAYQHYQNMRAKLIDTSMLPHNLPVSLVQEVVVQTNEQIFKKILSNLKSENLIRELCLALRGQLYLPMDFVLNKGDIAHEMFFIVDGTVYVLCSDKNTIAMTLTDGEHFGEADMFSETQRHQFYVQSVTFSTLNFLSKDQLQDIATIFPQILTKLEEAANRKQAVLDNFTTTVPAGADDHNPILVNLMNNSDSSSSPPHPRPLKTAFSQILNDQLGAAPATPEKRQRLGSLKTLKREKNHMERKASADFVFISQRQPSKTESDPSAVLVSGNQALEQPDDLQKPTRRLSDMSIGRQLIRYITNQRQSANEPIPSQEQGLRLQWNVFNQNKDEWL